MRSEETGLPAIELVASSSLTAADRKSDDPQNEQDDCNNPQEMQREPCSKENQDEQQCEKQQHRTDLSYPLQSQPEGPGLSRLPVVRRTKSAPPSAQCTGVNLKLQFTGPNKSDCLYPGPDPVKRALSSPTGSCRLRGLWRRLQSCDLISASTVAPQRAQAARSGRRLCRAQPGYVQQRFRELVLHRCRCHCGVSCHQGGHN
jgi:hypothetical protein